MLGERGASRLGVPCCLKWAFCHVECDFLTGRISVPLVPLGLAHMRNAGCHSRNAQCVPGMQASRSCLWERLLAVLEPGGEQGPGCQSRARPGGAWAAKLSKPTTPKLVVFEAVIYPNKETQWFC